MDPIGLPNIANDCWANALLQLLGSVQLTCVDIIKALKNHGPFDNPSEEKKRQLIQTSLFNFLKKIHDPPPGNLLREGVFPDDPRGEFEDATEALQTILDLSHTCGMNPFMKWTVTSYFTPPLELQTTEETSLVWVSDVAGLSKRYQKWILQGKKSKASSRRLMELIFDEATPNDEPRRLTGPDGIERNYVREREQKRICNAPSLFFLACKRWQQDSYGSIRKCNDPLPLPLRWSPTHLDPSNPNKKLEYELKGFVVHQMNHYYSVVYRNDKWFKCDDRIISERDTEEYTRDEFEQDKEEAYIWLYVLVDQEEKEIETINQQEIKQEIKQSIIKPSPIKIQLSSQPQPRVSSKRIFAKISPHIRYRLRQSFEPFLEHLRKSMDRIRVLEQSYHPRFCPSTFS